MELGTPKKEDQKQKPKQSGLFSSSSNEKKLPDENINHLKGDINALARRMRVIEEQTTNLRRKTQVMEQNMLRYNKKNLTDIKMINSDINDLKQMINDIDNKILLFIKELKLCAKKEDVNFLQKYVTMWEPIRFVTRNEVEKIVRDILDENNSEP